MDKIPTIFEREVGRSNLVIDLPAKGINWFWDGEGVATRKWDGEAVMVRNRKLYKRLNVRRIQEVNFEFIPCGVPDPVTGMRVGWTPVTDAPGDIWFHDVAVPAIDGTYELIGPRIKSNAERLSKQMLVMHGIHILKGVPRDYAGLKDYLRVMDIEGIVWWRGDDSRCKVKKIDFGFKR
jgi:hypothetical protein